LKAEELDVDTYNQFFTDIGNAAPELTNFFITENCGQTIRIGQLTTDKDLRP